MSDVRHRSLRDVADRTWDGLEIAQEPPYGASIIVCRRREGLLEFLILHRGHLGATYEGDWAWGPPAGARLPGESVEACAVRELQEETGLRLVLDPLPAAGADWRAFMAQAPADATVTLSAEHDRFEWLPLDSARERCRPVRVAQQIDAAARMLAGSSSPGEALE